MAQIRLNKFLSETGKIASRRKADEIIATGRIDVNDVTVTDLGFKVDPLVDTIKFDGETIKVETPIYYLLNKPKGYICSTVEENGKIPVTKLIKTSKKIFPVGRLDFNTTGTLILTNDGDFSYFLTHPKNNIPRIYVVTLNRPLDETVAERLVKGIVVEGKRGKFENIEFPKKKNRKILLVTCVEGRNHFVKNMFKVMGFMVENLHRTMFAGFSADSMRIGEYTIISPEDAAKVYEFYKPKPRAKSVPKKPAPDAVTVEKKTEAKDKTKQSGRTKAGSTGKDKRKTDFKFKPKKDVKRGSARK